MRYILIAFTLLYSTCFAEEMTDDIFPRTDPYKIGDIYQILKVMDRVFEDKKIDYWIDFGTLLGAERHGGIIPWDDDADVCIRARDLEKLKKLTKTFAKYGLVLTERQPQPWKLHFPETQYFCVDIFYILDLPNSPDGELTFYSNWAGHWYMNEVYPLREIPFGPITVSAPSWPWRRLHEQYGDDCMENATFHSHTQGDIPYKVTITDFSPAAWLIDPNHKIIRMN